MPWPLEVVKRPLRNFSSIGPNRVSQRKVLGRVSPIFEKFSEQVANGPRVVPWPVVYENVLISQILLKLKRRRAPQFYEAILLNKL